MDTPSESRRVVISSKFCTQLIKEEEEEEERGQRSEDPGNEWGWYCADPDESMCSTCNNNLERERERSVMMTTMLVQVTMGLERERERSVMMTTMLVQVPMGGCCQHCSLM